MPIRRSVRTIQPALRVRDLTLNEKLAFLGAWWEPGDLGRLGLNLRFSTWAEYFTVYAAVREEFLAERRNWPAFAELARPLFEAGLNPLKASVAYEAAKEAYVNRNRPAIRSRGERERSRR